MRRRGEISFKATALLFDGLGCCAPGVGQLRIDARSPMNPNPQGPLEKRRYRQIYVPTADLSFPWCQPAQYFYSRSQPRVSPVTTRVIFIPGLPLTSRGAEPLFVTKLDPDFRRIDDSGCDRLNTSGIGHFRNGGHDVAIWNRATSAVCCRSYARRIARRDPDGPDL